MFTFFLDEVCVCVCVWIHCISINILAVCQVEEGVMETTECLVLLLVECVFLAKVIKAVISCVCVCVCVCVFLSLFLSLSLSLPDGG